MNTKLILLGLFFATVCCAGVSAQETPQIIKVEGVRHMDQAPYRKFFKGMQVFGDNRHLAPDAGLRFRLYLRAKGASFERLVVMLVAGSTEIPVELDANQSFTLPFDARLVAQDAVVMTNKKAGTYAWRVDIRIPGLPSGNRRLGDLRLECRVDMKGAELRRMVRDPSIMALAIAGDPCTYRTFQNSFFADKPVFNVTLVDGARSESIAGTWMYANSAHLLPEAGYALVDWGYARDRRYLPALADVSWPDDTRLEFDFMNDPE